MIGDTMLNPSVSLEALELVVAKDVGDIYLLRM